MNTIPTNLWRFGIPVEQTMFHNNRYYVSVQYLTKFLKDDSDSALINNAKRIVRSHNMDMATEVKRLGATKYKHAVYYSEELIYLIIMDRDKNQRAKQLRLKFAQILWSSNHTMTLPFPDEELTAISDNIKALKKNLDFLLSEIEKSFTANQRTIVG